MRAFVAIAVVLFSLAAEASPLSELRDWWFGRSWDFVQSVGGIRVGDATRLEDGAVDVALECDVSGSKAITHQPEALNSGIGVFGDRHEREGIDPVRLDSDASGNLIELPARSILGNRSR
ncbi:MAG TPA: hypothetical protein VMW19_22490 [Myxococcota bacterium]|nr:hypothetical protein [Myxococcota bacterium]